MNLKIKHIISTLVILIILTSTHVIIYKLGESKTKKLYTNGIIPNIKLLKITDEKQKSRTLVYSNVSDVWLHLSTLTHSLPLTNFEVGAEFFLIDAALFKENFNLIEISQKHPNSVLTYEIETYMDGSKVWFYQNKLHRLDGPAIERADGTKSYYINDKYFKTEKEYKEAVIQLKTNER